MAECSVRPKKKLPAILSHYILPENTEGTFKASCKHCYKFISGSTKVSTNWLKHMVSLLVYIHVYII